MATKTTSKPQASIHALEAQRTSRDLPVQPVKASKSKAIRLAGLKPDRLATIIRNTEKGRLEDWADVCQFMMRDHMVRAVVATRTLAVSGADPDISAADDSPLADAAAEFCRKEAETSPGWEATISNLVSAEDVGWAASQHVWSRRNGEWHSSPVGVEARDIAFATDWTLIYRTYDEEHRENGVWIPSEDFGPRTLIPHIPAKGMKPTISGDFQAIAWPWLFRKWCELFRQEGLERYANALLIGRVPMNSPDVVRTALKQALENLSADQVAIMEEGTNIEVVEPGQRVGDAWSDAINEWDSRIIQVILGSTLNTEVGDTGGNRALGESQFATTTLPRLNAIAKRVSDTIEEHWFGPLLELNAHRFGGVVPPTPKMSLILVNDEPATVTAPDVAGGLRLTQNEWRASLGLEAISVEEGGEHFVEPPAPVPAFERVTGGEAAGKPPVPFGRTSPRQLRLPLTSRRAKHTPTCSASDPRLARLPRFTSDVPPR